jgi:hypothetical protein
VRRAELRAGGQAREIGYIRRRTDSRRGKRVDRIEHTLHGRCIHVAENVRQRSDLGRAPAPLLLDLPNDATRVSGREYTVRKIPRHHAPGTDDGT